MEKKRANTKWKQKITVIKKVNCLAIYNFMIDAVDVFFPLVPKSAYLMYIAKQYNKTKARSKL
mgnify:CR=1 FL=1